jgi:3-hydroxyisobutyrate dehydrogenase-like beta-hydroxyacid dehydrogenase
MHMERIGVIGLGRMGSAIAARLAGQGAEVTGWTRSGLAPDRAAELGIAPAATLAELVAASDILLTSLYDDAAVAEVVDALLDTDLAGRLLVETSTVAPSVLLSRRALIEGIGARALDAPISGGPDLVLAGGCGIFVGGSDADAARARPVLDAITPRHFHVGPLGTGMVMKVINNSMLQTYTAGLVEQMRLAKRAGLPLETAIRIVCGGPAGLPMITDRIPKILGEDAEVGFTVAGILKDVQIFQRVARDHGVETPTLAAAEAMERAAVAEGLEDADPAHMIAHAYHSA